MRLFFVCKQFTMRRDFIADRYWRLWHLPLELARRGHAVAGLACAYYAGHAAGTSVATGQGWVTWRSCRLAPPWPPSWLAWRRELLAFARSASPEAVVASSDALQLAAGAWLARRLAVPLIVDFYDNYETYGASRVPGATAMIRRAARAAAGVSFVSDPLREHLVGRYGLRGRTLTLENAVEDSFIAPPARFQARQSLGVPAEAKLIGTAGALDNTRNIGALYEAFERLAPGDPALHLVLAGEPRDVAPPAHPRVIRLGTLAPARMPAFWRALDVAAIGLRDDAFGRYCYPQKLAEIAAVGTPVVFPHIGVFSAAGADALGVAASTNDGPGFAAAISRQLAAPRPPAMTAITWSQAAARLEAFIQDCRP